MVINATRALISAPDPFVGHKTLLVDLDLVSRPTDHGTRARKVKAKERKELWKEGERQRERKSF